MRKVYLFFPVFIALVLSLPVVSARDADDENKQFHKQAYDNPHKISVKIQQAIAEIDSGHHLEIEGEYVFSNSVLPEFYANRDYMPAWDNYEALLDAIYTLEHAYVDGLEPADYHADAMRVLVERIRHNAGGEEAHFVWVAEFDILLTDGLLMYAYHLLDGKVHPETLDPNWNYDFREIDPHAPYILEKAVETASVSEVIGQMRPQMEAYTSMMELLAEYRELARNGGWDRIPAGETIHPGEKDVRIPMIRERLSVSGELTAGNDSGSDVYDSILVADVRRFQHRNALKPDGVIGQGTIDEMNVSVETRIDMLRINMERLRWIVADLT